MLGGRQGAVDQAEHLGGVRQSHGTLGHHALGDPRQPSAPFRALAALVVQHSQIILG